MIGQMDTTAAYARSINPPRRAKRSRTDSISNTEAMPDGSTSPARPTARRPRPPILPKNVSTDADGQIHDPPESESDEEDEYDPSMASAAPKRRGRKPGALSRSARESLRKLNHSRIEKARRTKINETLSTLSTLVNEAEAKKEAQKGAGYAGNTAHASHAAAEADSMPKRGKAKNEEKEFKLDVLVKTVAYMQELIERVKTLEAGACTNCSHEQALPVSGTKRKRVDEHEDSTVIDVDAIPSNVDEAESYVGDEEKAEEDDNSPAASVQPYISPRLPSIASWLPHPHLDPSSIAALSEPVPNAQLPSPPPSGRFRPASSISNVPVLTLPGPVERVHLPPTIAPRHSPSAPQQTRPRSPRARLIIPSRSVISASRRGSVSAPRMTGSFSRSPPWTPEDESAASLLLQMSSSPISAVSASSTAVSTLNLPKTMDLSPRNVYASPKDSYRAFRALQPETPSSLLGLERD